MEKVAFVLRNDKCHMVPGHIVINKPEEIRFSVVGQCTQVTLIFPDGSIFGQGPNYMVELDKTSTPPVSHKNLPIHGGAAEGVYSFVAYCKDTKSFAIGGSDGEIIIQT